MEGLDGNRTDSHPASSSRGQPEMVIQGFIWIADIVDKLEEKHFVSVSEVERVFTRFPVFNRIQRGHVKDEDLYRALGQTESGRYITVFFIYKMTRDALVISARDMTEKERRQYAKRKK
jgi:uncharacterized DUF497 family protein